MGNSAVTGHGQTRQGQREDPKKETPGLLGMGGRLSDKGAGGQRRPRALWAGLVTVAPRVAEVKKPRPAEARRAPRGHSAAGPHAEGWPCPPARPPSPTRSSGIWMMRLMGTWTTGLFL